MLLKRFFFNLFNPLLPSKSVQKPRTRLQNTPKYPPKHPKKYPQTLPNTPKKNKFYKVEE